MIVRTITNRYHEWIENELLTHLQNLIRIDTRTSLNQEILAAKYIGEKLADIGINSTIVEPLSGKGNIIASLPASGECKPLVLLCHLDTADWDEKDWAFHPLSGALSQGYIWGRGAIDCKGLAAIWITIFRLWKIANLNNRRTLILSATADEEAGGTWGAKWMLENTRLLPNNASVLSEGGGYKVTFGRHNFFTCQTGEKGLIATHPHLLEAVRKHILETSKKYPSPTVKAFIQTVLESQGLFYRFLSLNSGLVNYLLLKLQKDNTYKLDTLELLNSSIIIPSDNPQESLIRVSPTSYDWIESCNHENEIKVIETPFESGINSDLFNVIRSTVKTAYPSYNVLPHISSGYSDNRFFRKIGCETYGFFPIIDTQIITTMHRPNERIDFEGFKKSFEILFRIIFKFIHGSTDYSKNFFLE